MFCPNCGTAQHDDALFCSACGAALAGTATSAGDHLGPYELRGELGRGAMARVWRAWDSALEREVAIKEPLLDQSLSGTVRDEMARRFVKEARTAARLLHPGIVTVFAADVYDNRPAIVMELVEGKTLTELLGGGSLGAAAALDALDQLLDAIGYAHAHGVVHRDIKPDNIFVDTEGRIRLADFGVAHVDGLGGTAHGTVAGTVLGTPGYMSPEQARGDAVGARSDLFSVGVVAYEMFAGHHPFGADTCGDATTLLYRIVHENPAELSDASCAGLPADVRPAIMAALSKDPQQRPQTAEAMKSMLHGGKLPIGAQGAGTTPLANAASKSTLPKWLPYAAVGFAGAVVLVVVLMGAFGNSGGSGGGAATTPSTSYTYSTTTQPTDEVETATSTIVNELSAPFYGVFSYQSYYDNKSIAQEFADELTAQGFDSVVVNNNKWEGLTGGSKYSVTTGTWDSETDAEDMADQLNAAGYSGVDVLYSGSKVEDDDNTVTVTVKTAKGKTLTGKVHRDKNGYVLADSLSHEYSKSELKAMKLTDAELCIAWNEPFARQGYHFKNPGLRKYFNSCSWYTDTHNGSNLSGTAAKNNTTLRAIAAADSSAKRWMSLATS